MADYTLHYWPIAFRGQFVRAVLAHAGVRWEEADVSAIEGLLEAEPADQPVPHMGPPVLTDRIAGLSLAQMPAILAYLGTRHALLPGDAARQALTHKIVADTNDVLYEMTLHNGAQLWTAEAWSHYRPRLCRWLAIFEETGRRNGLTAASGHILGTAEPGIADLTTAILWRTMTDKLSPLRPLLDETAPAVAGLSDRIAALPEQAELRAWSDAQFPDEWCSGEIEASLRAVI